MRLSEKDLMDLERELAEEATTVEDVLAGLAVDKNGKVRQSIENVVSVLEHDPVLAGAICDNDLFGRWDIVKEMPWKRSGTAFTDTDENYIKLYLEQNYGLTSERCIRAGLDITASKNSFHPIRELLEQLHWDGTPRIGNALHHFLGAEQNSYTAAVLKTHMLAAISRVFTPGCKYDIVLCLVGGQGAGKSTFFRLLAIKDQWFTDDLRRFEDKGVFEKINGHWIIELSEMNATANAKSIEETKAFISRQKETYRVPYGRFPKDYPRQCVFCGTTNDGKFLAFDRSGNRRFAPVAIDPNQAEVHPMADEAASRVYILQMWAEAMEIYRSKDFSLTFPQEIEAYALEMQKKFMPEDTEMGQIEQYLEDNRLSRTCVKEIYCQVYNHYSSEEVPYYMSKKITEVLTSLGWQDVGSRKFPKYGSQKAWVPSVPNPPHLSAGFPEYDPDLPC
jgi:predicted P-loop ATPase